MPAPPTSLSLSGKTLHRPGKSLAFYIHRFGRHLQHKRLSQALRWRLIGLPGRLMAYLWELLNKRSAQIRKISHRFSYALGDFNVPSFLLGDAQARNIRRVMAAHLVASRSYIARPFPGRIHLFQSSEHDDSERKGYVSRCEVWSGLAAGGLIHQVILGDHHTLLHEETCVQILAEKMGACLDELSTGRY